MSPIIVGPAALEVLRRVGIAERAIIRDNVKAIQQDPARVGLPVGDDFLPPATWSHTCPDSTFIVLYRWASDRDETMAMADLLASIRREDDPPPPTRGEDGLLIVNVTSSYVAL
jgi:hypothetical protein